MGETLPSMSHWPSHDNRIRPDVMVSREDGDALHIPVFLSEKDDSENRDEPGINVRLLKERLEMEVGMRREGLRAIAFAALCVCFATAFFISSQPPSKSASRWFVAEKLNLKQLQDVTTPVTLFHSIMDVSSTLRSLSPLSSDYLGDPLGKVMIAQTRDFPGGPIELPASRHPRLLLEWTLTARVKNLKPDDPLPKRKLIVRAFPAGDTSGLSCWAWYTWGPNTYSLEYGRNNLDDEYPVIHFDFESTAITTRWKARNLVGLIVNSTHATIRLQDGGSLTHPLHPGTVVADCIGRTVVEAGHPDLEIGNLMYRPYAVNGVQFLEVEQIGQTLESMASGMEVKNPGPMADEVAVQAHTRTQSLVSHYGTSNLAVSKLTGALVFSGVDEEMKDAPRAGNKGVSPEEYETLGTVLPVDNATGSRNWAAPSGMNNSYWQVVDEPVDMADGATLAAVSAEAAAAFRGLSVANQASFTFSWWSRLGEGLDIKTTDVLFGSAPDGRSKFRLEHDTVYIDQETGLLEHGWRMNFNNAPWCASESDYPCMKSPSVACRGPGTGGFFGIWRHMALSFKQGSKDDGVDSEMELFVDGRSLCGIRFQADPDIIPHYMPGENYGVEVMAAANIAGGMVQLRDARVYPRALSPREVKILGQDPEIKQCFDLEFNRDNSTWISDFGQSCADLAGLNSGDTNAPAACKTSAVKLKCPVACLHEMNPTCNDGSPPLSSQGGQTSLFTLGARVRLADVYIQMPEFGLIWQPISVSTEALGRLRGAFSWLMEGTRPNGEWFTVSKTVRKMGPGTMYLSRSAGALAASQYADRGFFLKSWDLDESDFRDKCIGDGLDYLALIVDRSISTIAEHNLITDICKAELSEYTSLRQISGSGDPSVVAPKASFVDVAFEDNLVMVNQSYTLYFYAQSEYILDRSEPRLTAIDDANNVCFAIRGNKLWFQKHNLIEEYLEWADQQAADWKSALAGAAAGGRLLDEHKRAAELAEGRMGISVDNGTLIDYFRPSTWIFFAVSVDMFDKVIRFAINSFVKEVPLPEGTWGCNNLKAVINTGAEIDISPIRVAGFALPSGSLQRLYLASQGGYRSGSRGEELSRLQRLEPTSRPFKNYSGRIVLLAPPILMQRRVVASAEVPLKCDDEIVDSYNGRQAEIHKIKCQYPYRCDLAYAPVECVRNEGPAPESFFGQKSMETSPGVHLFPEFAWTLDNEMVIRDGRELYPAQDYIDNSSVELFFYIAFYVPTSRIATIVRSSFDLTGMKIATRTQYLQLAVLSKSQFESVLMWAIAGIVTAAISIVMAFPAAIKELMEAYRGNTAQLKRALGRMRDPKSIFADKDKIKQDYSSNTTQPDVFDVLLNLAMICLLGTFLVNQKYNLDHASQIFSKTVDIDWGSNLSFDAKIESFMGYMTLGMDMVETEETFVNAAFWMLAVCCVRMIIYLRIHPNLASITETFISVGRELINFLFSFALIFIFMAFIAHVRFGYRYDDFATMEQSLITQFSLLIGDSSPDYTQDTLMCLYVVTYVFVCTLSLLNFLLAIVVNGYTDVTERALENHVARSFLWDALAVPIDAVAWFRHPVWPSKLDLLVALQAHYPYVFEDEEEIVVCMKRNEFRECVAAAGKKAGVKDADEIFYRYSQMESLLIMPEHANDQPYRRAQNYSSDKRANNSDRQIGVLESIRSVSLRKRDLQRRSEDAAGRRIRHSSSNRNLPAINSPLQAKDSPPFGSA